MKFAPPPGLTCFLPGCDLPNCNGVYGYCTKSHYKFAHASYEFSSKQSEEDDDDDEIIDAELNDENQNPYQTITNT